MLFNSNIKRISEIVASVGGFPVDQLTDQQDLNLIANLGLDSIQLLQIWVAIEKEFKLPEGTFGVTQAATIAAISDELAGLQKQSKQNSILLDQSEIEALIPHRPPILMLNRITELEPGKRGVGIKDLPLDDPCFIGHFPDKPILPGIFIVEACAQLTAIVCRSAVVNRTTSQGSTQIEYLASIDRFKFINPVIPGQPLTLVSDIGKRSGNLLQARVGANVIGTPVAEGVLIVTSHN